MYKIIGADGREYGPISADQLRQWIAEGRANAQTKVLLEGTTEWRLLSELPEFGATIPSAAPSMPGAAVAPAATLDQVNGPAIGLIVVAILGFLMQVTALIWQLGFSAMTIRQAPQPWMNVFFSGTVAVISGIVGILVSGLILFGGMKMKRLENHGLAMAASIVAMVPCISPCCVIGLPIGIWALVVLSKPEVKSAFH